MAELAYLLSYAGIPFVSDRSQKIEAFGGSPKVCSLVDEINKRIPLQYLQDFGAPHSYPGRTTDGLAMVAPAGLYPTPAIRVGDWYYPNTACRWSVFRGLATSAMIKAMMEATGGGGQFKPFTIKSCPISPDNPGGVETNYTITTNLRMLPPRPIGELGGDAIGGLYLVTLVDERYDWQHKPATLRVTQNTSWADLFSTVATTLGITLTYNPGIEAAAMAPEPDSQLWANAESAAVLLDALAYNVGCCVVRNYDGTYVIMDPLSSRTIAETNRGSVLTLARTAGGDLFASGGKLAVGNLTAMRNSVTPANITVQFPKYIIGNDPVPHFLNPRQSLSQPSTWQEDSYGEMYSINVPIQSGTCYSGSQFSGISGVGTQYIHNLAKALYSGEIQASGTPLNNSGLTSLAMFLAKDRYDSQAAVALDEVYPGTYAWTPEGVHDLIFTYSDTASMATTRVMRTEWNSVMLDAQHRTPTYSGLTGDVAGAAGQSVAQTWQGGWSGSVVSALSGNLASGGYTTLLASGADNFPTDRRWKGLIGTERVLFDGTSGGLNVTIAKRGIDGTVQSPQSGAVVSMLTPQDTYGVNLVRFGTGQHVLPSDWTSGGILGVDVVPQLQSVYVQSASGVTIKGNTLYSGRVNYVEPSVSGNHYVNGPLCWVWERNGEAVYSGKRYGGQFVGWTASGPCAQVYGINGFVASGGGGTPSITSGSVGSGALGNGAVVSGSIASGQLGYYHLSALLQAYLDSCCCDVFIVTQSGDYVVTQSGEFVKTNDNTCENVPSSGSVNSGSLASGLLNSFSPTVNQFGLSGQSLYAANISGINTLQFFGTAGFRVSGFTESGTANVSLVEANRYQQGTVSENLQRWIGVKVFEGGNGLLNDISVQNELPVLFARSGLYVQNYGLTTHYAFSGLSSLEMQARNEDSYDTRLRVTASRVPNASGDIGNSGFYGVELDAHDNLNNAISPQFRIRIAGTASGGFASGQYVINSGGYGGLQFRAGWLTNIVPLESGTLLGNGGLSGGVAETYLVGSGLITTINASGRPVVRVGSGQITSEFIASGAVTSGKISSGTVPAVVFASGSIIAQSGISIEMNASGQLVIGRIV
jgi:hypothetical protein